MLTRLKKFVGRLLGRTARADPLAQSAARVERLRRQGVVIGEGCVIFTDQFSLEPYLVEIGNRVAIAGGTIFLTHDGAACLLRQTRPEAQHFGRIVVGDDTYIGQNCIILPAARIGSHCIIGAGSVVRGTIPDNSVTAGNPAQVVGRTSLLLAIMDKSPDTLDTFSLPMAQRQRRIRAHFVKQ
jgi:acetyltransferase-like isoleucine patch superfamily enzyme